MKAIFKDILMYLLAFAGGIIMMFGCFSEVESDNAWWLIGTRFVGIIGMVILIAASNSTSLRKYLDRYDRYDRIFKD